MNSKEIIGRINEKMFSDLRSNIWKIQALKAVYGFLLLTPIIVLFWRENGLSMTEIMILQSLYSAAVILLEVPSGYVADVFGRRKTLLASGTAATAGMIGYSLGHNFVDFLIAELIWAFGMAFLSGADTALLYDSLAELGEEAQYKKHWGRANYYYLLSAAAASLLGGFIGDFNLRWPLFAQIPIIALLIPLSYSLKEPDHHKDISKDERATIREIIKGSIVDRPELRWLMIYGALITATLQAGFWLYQPYFELTGLDVAYFGVIFAAFNVISAGSSKYAYLIEEKIGKTVSLILLMVLTVASFFLLSKITVIFGFTFIFLQQLVRGFSKPVISDYVNELISSDRRSTILSTQSLISRGLQALGFPLVGWISDAYSIGHAFGAIGITLLAAGTGLLLLLKAENVLYLEKGMITR